MLHSIHGRSRTALALLVNGGHAPHIRRVTPSKYRQADASPHHAAAIARWEEEGGAATSLASVKIDQALAEEEKILEYFGRGRDHAMGHSTNQNPARTLRTRCFPRRSRADGRAEGADCALLA